MQEQKDCRYAATIGFFDGVHTGHRYLFEQLEKLAAGRGLKSMAVTFPEHPCHILDTAYKPRLLSTSQEKLKMLARTGIDYCFPLHFTSSLAKMDARSFMTCFLRDKLQVRLLLVGHDHHFGCDCQSTFSDYQRIGREIGMEVFKADAFNYMDHPVSSSRIRRELEAGNIKDANAMLGYRYTVSGTVIRGLQNGRRMGFPTANLGPYCEFLMLPADGVYSAVAQVDGQSYPAMVNIGCRPTFDGSGRTIEAHLLGFDRDIYFHELSLQFVSFIRKERKFESARDLAVQLDIDKKMVLERQE